MKLALTLFFVLIQLFCFAQANDLRIEPANVTKEVVVDDLEKGYQDITNITVTNVSGHAIDLVRKQVVGKKPKLWDYGIYSRRNAGSSPFVVPENDNEADRPVRLGPGESAAYAVVLNSAGKVGQGSVGIIFADKNLPGVNLGTANFTTRIVRRNTTENAGGGVPRIRRPVPTTVSLYPNPARERFFVEVPTGVRLGRVNVANTLGKQLKSFPKSNGKAGYDIEKLPDGLYLISIYDDRGKKLKTLRLLHRRFGA